MSRAKHAHKRRGGCLKFIFIFLLIVVLAAVGLVVYFSKSPVQISQRVPQTTAAPTNAPAQSGDTSDTPGASSPTNAPEPTAEPIELSINEELATNEWVNILLLGTDASDPDQPGRTDTMIIASVNIHSGDLKLTSIMRDTYVKIAGHGSNKITSANWFGGPDLAIRTVNENFGMNISHYAMVDFSSFAYIVDALGGVDLAVTENEMKYVNQLMADMRVLYPEIQLEKNDLTEFGESVHLDGMQTLAFSRIRKLDSDHQRTGRQRQVLNAILQKLRSVRDVGTLYELFDIGLSYTRTSLTPTDIIQLALKVIMGGADFQELKIPANGAYSSETIKEMSVLNPNLEKNTQLLHDFIYGADAE